MSNQLQENLDAILLDKNTNLLPENLKKDVTVLGVTGTLEAGSSDPGMVTYKDVDTMNADTTQPDGTICIVGMNDVDTSVANTTSGVGLVKLSATIPTSIIQDDLSIQLSSYAIYIDSTHIYTVFDAGMGMIEEITWYTVEGDNYVRNNEYSELMRLSDISGEGLTTRVTISADNIASGILNYLGFVVTAKTQLYMYNASTSIWKLVPNTYITSASDIKSGKVAYTYTGLTTGTYETGESRTIKPVVLQSYDSTNIYFWSSGSDIPELQTANQKVLNVADCPNLADKRYFIVDASFSDPMGMSATCEAIFVTDNVDAVITQDYCSLSNDDTWTAYNVNAMSYSPQTGPTIGTLKALANHKLTDSVVSGKSFSDIGDMMALEYSGQIITNCKIVNTDGTVLVPAGVKASDIPVGSYYINIFGQKVNGTQVPYEGTISPTEYTEAVETADEIAGTTPLEIPKEG